MRIMFQTSGGVGLLPGLAGPRIIEVGDLAPDEREGIAALVRDSRFFERAPAAAVQSESADHRTYRITVVDHGLERTLTIEEPVEDPALRALVTKLRLL